MSDDLPVEAIAAEVRAREHLDARRFVDAIAEAAAAARLAPSWAPPWRDLALAYKHTQQWRDAIAAAERVVELLPEDDHHAMHWTAGIAATALGQWKRARAAWRACGIDLPESAESIDLDLGVSSVRIPCERPRDVVWIRRLDPARGRILNVPLPEADRRYGDLVLHDGEPRGERMHKGRPRPVFDELALLERSQFGTWLLEITAPEPADVETIVTVFEDTDVVIEDWTAAPGEPWISERRLGVAARHEDDLRRLRRLGRWRMGIRAVQRVL